MSQTSVSTENILSVNSLKECPVRITAPSQEKTDSINKLASHKNFIYEPVKVAAVKTNTKDVDQTIFYVVDGHDVVDAFRENKLESIRCKIYQVDSIADAVILHISLHQQNPINPMKFLEASKYLQGKGVEGKSLVKALLLSDQQKQLLRCNFSSRAIEILEGFLEELSGIYDTVQAYPYHMLIRIGKIPEANQEQAIRNIINSIDVSVPEHKFCFPATGQLDVLVTDAKPAKITESKTFIFEKSKNDDPTKKGTTTLVPTPSVESDQTSSILSQHEIMMSCSCNQKFVIDTKKQTVSPMDDANDSGVVVIKGDVGKRMGMIPSDVFEDLGLDNSEKIYSKVIDQKGLRKLLSKNLPKSSKFYIISADKI
jgi:hypothetical protein